MEAERAEHERKLGDREKMGDLMLNISQSKNSQEVESQEKTGAYPRMQGTGGGRWTPPCPPSPAKKQTPFFRGSFRELQNKQQQPQHKKNQREKQERPT